MTTTRIHREDRLTADEAETRRLIREYRAARDTKLTTEEQVVLNLFGAFHWQAFTAARLHELAVCVYRLRQDASLASALRRLVAAKVLRTDASQRKRYYEVNY